MSKAELPLEGKPNPPLIKVSGNPEDYPQHLATTARGVALARQALAEASERALQAEALHRANLERIHAEDKAIISALRVQMYGAKAEQAMAEVEALESDVWAEAELALEGIPDPLEAEAEGEPDV